MCPGGKRDIPVVAAVLPPAGFVFPGRFGGHVQPGTVVAWLHDALPRPWSGHSLRHSYATDFYVTCGRDLIWTAEVLGHSSVETTRRYVHTVRDGRAVAQLIGTGVAG